MSQKPADSSNLTDSFIAPANTKRSISEIKVIVAIARLCGTSLRVSQLRKMSKSHPKELAAIQQLCGFQYPTPVLWDRYCEAAHKLCSKYPSKTNVQDTHILISQYRKLFHS